MGPTLDSTLRDNRRVIGESVRRTTPPSFDPATADTIEGMESMTVSADGQRDVR